MRNLKNGLFSTICFFMAFAIGVITTTFYMQKGHCLINEGVLFGGLILAYGATSSGLVDWTKIFFGLAGYMMGAVATFFGEDIVVLDSRFNIIPSWSVVFLFGFVLALAMHGSGADGNGVLTKKDGG